MLQRKVRAIELKQESLICDCLVLHLKRATDRGAKILWTKHYWKEFNGFNHAFEDPWGNEIILWGKAGPEPKIPDDYTRE